MSLKLEIEKVLGTKAQFVKDEDGNTSALSIGTPGNVGIGTTNPAVGLHIKSSGKKNAKIRLEGNIVDDDPTLNFNSGPTQKGVVGWDFSDNLVKLLYGNNIAGSKGIVINSSGNVGIGTTSPAISLHIKSSGKNNAKIRLEGDLVDDDPTLNFYSGSTQKGVVGWDFSDNLVKLLYGNTINGSKGIIINSSGQVGIGTTNPREKLEVEGNILATGDVRLVGADCAEDFDVEESLTHVPGTVMVIGDEDKLHQSKYAYDKKVAGVISGAGDCKPGIVLGKQEFQNGRMPLALSGKVYCKVDAQYSPINVGDLLTTSPTPGHAMKVDDSYKAFGAVIGKALRPCTAGQGLIPILIALQ